MPSVNHSISRRARMRIISATALTGMFLAGPLAPSAHAAILVPLGTASAFSVLAGSTVTNTGPTTVSRNVGLHPGSSVTGANEMTVGGAYHVGDAVALDAKNDLTTAYNHAAGPLQNPVTNVATNLGGTNLVGGTYNTGGAMALTGQLTLDAAGDPNTVWVFQTDSTLITATDSSVIFVNGVGNPCNVFWQVGSSATLGVRTDFIGTIMASTTITMNTNATLVGRVLASTGAVNLDSNTITGSACAFEETTTGGTAAPPTASPSPTPTPTAGAGGTGGTGGTGNGGNNGGTGDAGDDDVQVAQAPAGAVDTGYAGPVGDDSSKYTILGGWVLAAGFGGLALVALRRRQHV